MIHRVVEPNNTFRIHICKKRPDNGSPVSTMDLKKLELIVKSLVLFKNCLVVENLSRRIGILNLCKFVWICCDVVPSQLG